MSPKLSRILATLSGLLLVIFLMLVVSEKVPVFSDIYQRLELLVYDQRMRFHLPEKNEVQPSDGTRIVIIDIDEESLQHEGRWPWSRLKMVDLVEKLNAAGAAVIGFDILFGEAERNPAQVVLSQLDKKSKLHKEINLIQHNYDSDQMFANTLANSEAILGYLFHFQYPLTSGLLPEPLPLENTEDNLVSQLGMPSMTGYAAPIEVLTSNAKGGFFSLALDQDGVTRRAPMLARYNNQLYPSLSLEMLRQFLLLDAIELETSTIKGREHLEKIHLGANFSLPTDSSGQLLIPYRGPAETFPYIPAWKLLSGDFDKNLVEGALIIIGTSAPGLFDLRATPIDSVYPGVEVHANLLAAMLDKKFLKQPSWVTGADFVIALISGLVLAIALPWLTPLLQFVLSLSVAAIILAVTGWLWASKGLVLALAGPLLVVYLLITIFNFIWGFFYEFMTRNLLTDMFGQYVPPELVEEMSKHPGEFSFAGESRELSVLFSDIRGFTSLSERLTADELKLLLNRYFTPVTGVIFDHRGTIDKYIGDLVMAFWGAPVVDPDHALHSIQAALQMLKATEEISAVFASEGLPEIKVGIGINSGEMSVGDMGSKYRRAYTVLGDAVNLASRLESSTKYYGVSLIVGERTKELALEHFVWRELDLVRVKGKDQPVKIYQPLCSIEELTPELEEELKLLDQALAAFRSQDFTQAKNLFSQLHESHPETYQYSQYLERLEQFNQEPPATEWDGSWVRVDK
ncbi:CHASE2 domain-containing protein [Marinospirillum insulare]|uniref:Adenylate/guanylate cyclase domain-containing protein n=1 Tax=Marinospirillum insulare TaxID=217169 RepID=A0ABQ5ZVN0_9GAMM|nr:adenylate/guanylate cyclase domain-containing protein [Marinospirillum insulare]GLR63090.1 adenylate/guanylate cyclase domain-containing protein [Marinospirillum insulare]